MKHNPRLETALSYAALGWYVFPLHSVRAGKCSCGRPTCGKNTGKHPRTTNGFKDATIDESKIRGWWAKWPNAHVGIRTGRISNLVVLDVDPRNGGDATLKQRTVEHGKPPKGPRARTGGGGEHIFFAYPKKGRVKSSNDATTGLDVKADGGYVVGSPADHHSGGEYAWMASRGPDLPLPPMPSWVAVPVAKRAAMAARTGEPHLDPVLDIAKAAGQKPIRKGNEWVVLCPLHADSDPSLRLNEEKNSFMCDPCGKGGGPSQLREWFSLPSRPPYRIAGRQLCWEKRDRDGNIALVPLCNFTATIDEEVTMDDGVEAKKVLAISGVDLATTKMLPMVRVKADEFASLAWVMKSWGSKAVILAGRNVDHIRVATQLLSSPSTRTVFRHTGWRLIDGHRAYLHAGGAIGADDVAVELDGPLSRLAFPPTTESLTEAVRCSLSILDCAPYEVTIPLLAATYLAPLMEVLVVDCALWLVGASGSLKTELATLAQKHFGASFDRKRLPADWTSTDNALEGIIFRLKDAVCVIDDYAPQADAYAQQQQARKATRIIRGIGNGSSRSRLNADLSERPNRPPRAMVISTGEDTPPVGSIIARLFVVEVERDQVVLEHLTRVQSNAARLVHAMRGFIEWLQPQMTTLPKELAEAKLAAAEKLGSKTGHLRQADALAHFYVAFGQFLRFARSVDAISDAERAQWLKEGRLALRAAAAKQRDHQAEIDPARRFIEVLGELLATGQVRLRHDKSLGLEAGTFGSEAIGWRDGDNALLKPEVTRAHVAAFLRRSGETSGLSTRSLNKLLVKKGYLLLNADKKPQTQVRAGGGKHRVMVIPLRHLETVEEDEVEPQTATAKVLPMPLVEKRTRGSLQSFRTDGKPERSASMSPMSRLFQGKREKRARKAGDAHD